jgi:hypothetical protein
MASTTTRILSGAEIEALIGRLGDTDDSAVEAIRGCGDPGLVAAIREREQGTGAEGSPADLYPGWLAEIASDRDARR